MSELVPEFAAWRGASLTLAWPLTITSPMYCSSLVARSRRGVNSNSSGVSSMNRVVQLPARKVGSWTRRIRNGMFVFTPRMRNSCKHRSVRLDSFAEGAAPRGHLNKQRIIERRYDGTREGGAAIESDAHAAR